MNNVIVFPKTLSKSVAHSLKLELALKNFIISMGGSYYEDAIEQGILTSYFRLDHGICVEQRIQIGKLDCVCYTTLSHSISAEELMKYAVIINEINTQLDYGNFEIEEKTGVIRFRTYYEAHDRIPVQALDRLLGYPKYVVNQYGQLFFAEHSLGKGWI